MLTCLMLVGSALYAQPAPRKYEFEIEKVSLSDAIRQFSMSTGLQILYLPETEAEERQIVGPVKGSYTPEEALTEMLKPTGLKFSWVNERTIGIERPPPPPSKAVTPKGSATSRVEPKREPAAQIHRVPGLLYQMNVVERPWLQGSIEDGVVSLLTFDRTAIERMGASTVSDVIRNISQQTYMPPPGSRASGAQYAELRGLGSPDNTLVLVNRRRALPSAANVTTNAFDLNTIPLPAVERIEVLLDSGSVAYGTDAIGGIVNIVLRTEIADPAAEVHYGAAAGGGDERRFSLSVGHKGEEVSAALVMDYFEIDHLIGAERERWRDQDYRRFGGQDLRSPFASPGNVTSLMPFNLPGLSSRFAAVPIGSAGNTIEDFVATAGTMNLESLFQYVSIAPQARRFSASGVVDVKLTDKMAASAEVLYVDRSADFQQFPPFIAGPNAIVPATNAFNPFGLPVMAQVLLTGIGPQTENVEAKLLRAVAALRGAIWSWGWEISVLDTQEDAWNWTDKVIDPVRLTAALASADRAQALDVFNDGPGGSPELLASLVGPRQVRTFGSDGRQGLASLGGPLFDLGAGSVSAVLGGEHRREAAEFDATLGSFDRDISAAFAELRVPLVSASMNVPAIEDLVATLAVRWDDYSDSGDVINPQFGLTWKPHGDVTVRLSHARTFRPPSLYELYLPEMPQPSAVADPRRGGALTPVVLLIGGNRDLVPIEGELSSASLIFNPSVIPGLKLMTSLWHVSMDERITFFSPTSLVANEAAFPNRVVRAAPTPAEAAMGLPGRLLTLDTSRLNLGRLETKGVDFNASYEFDTGIGRLTPGLAATWIDEYETVDLPGTAKQDRVGVASDLGTIVRWRAAATLAWGRGAFSAFAAAHYLPSYDDAFNGVRTGRVVDSQTTLDVQASVDLGGLISDEGLWQGMRLTLGATNITDEMPPFSQVSSLAGFDFSQGDLKGRFVYLRLGKTF